VSHNQHYPTLLDPYYEDEHATIYHGDWRAVLAALEADVLVTDPPYGYAHESGREGKFKRQQIANDADLTERDDLLAWWGERPAIIFGSWKRPRPAHAHTLLVWDKGPASGMGNLSIPWKPSHEEIYVCGDGFTGARTEGVLKGYTVPTWSGNGQRVHPNEKPVGLLRHLVGKCPPGVVLDPFMGSGSTLRAAKDLGRRCIGVELEERYCEIAAKRLGQEVLDVA
jgi:DNA modification methylase